MGRHSAAAGRRPRSRRPLVYAAAGVVALLLIGLVVVKSLGSDGGGAFAAPCSSPLTVKVTTTPELAPELQAASKAIGDRKNDSGQCATYTISTVGPATVASSLAEDDPNRPDL